jgi:hypothetical protein
MTVHGQYVIYRALRNGLIEDVECAHNWARGGIVSGIT